MAPLVMGAMLAACATPSQQRNAPAARAQSELIGLSKSALLACAGQPARSTTMEDSEYLTYGSGSRRAGDVLAGGNARMPAAVVATTAPYCRVTFVMKDGRVEKISYSGYTGLPLAESRECSLVSRACLKK